MKHLSFFVLLLFFTASTGCSTKPSGMPDCVPCRILVQKGGQPLEGVRVTLRRDVESGSINVTGLTDTAGYAKIGTQLSDYKATGAPVGQYKVTLYRLVPKPADMSDIDWQKYVGAGKADDPDIPPRLRMQQTTPLTFNVQKSGDEMKIELNALGD